MRLLHTFPRPCNLSIRRQFRIDGNFEAWAHRIATNLAVDYLRRVSAGLKGSHYRRFEVSQIAVSNLLKDTNALTGATGAAALSSIFLPCLD